MGLQDAAFMPSRASFSITVKKMVVGVKVSGPPQILDLCFWVGTGMLHVKYVCSIKASLYQSNLM